MNRKIFLILFTLFSIVQINSLEGPVNFARDFWRAYFGSIKGSEFVFDADCLSGKFDEYYNDLVKALVFGDLDQVFTHLKMIIKLDDERMSVDDFRLIDDNKTIENIKLVIRIL